MHTPHQLVVSGWYGVLLQRRKLQLVLHAATMPKLSTEHHRSAITETITSRTFLSVCYSPGGVNKKAQLKSEDFLLHTPPPVLSPHPLFSPPSRSRNRSSWGWGGGGGLGAGGSGIWFAEDRKLPPCERTRVSMYQLW